VGKERKFHIKYRVVEKERKFYIKYRVVEKKEIPYKI